MHQRVISQRVDHDEDEENGLDEEQPTAKPELGRQEDSARGSASNATGQQQPFQGSDLVEGDNGMEDADEEDIELYEVSLTPEEGATASDSQDDGFSQAATEGINTDEFEHIAEIYD